MIPQLFFLFSKHEAFDAKQIYFLGWLLAIEVGQLWAWLAIAGKEFFVSSHSADLIVVVFNAGLQIVLEEIDLRPGKVVDDFWLERD